ncbi:MAG: hypothetical protein HYZ53_16765 [Planctomycetes bacterium]|nr:hypothetical protein [Planctomycetota bacterium]
MEILPKGAEQPPAFSLLRVEIGWKKVTRNQALHQYSLAITVCLERPPRIDGFRLSLKWPVRVRIRELVGFVDDGQVQIGEHTYRRLRYDSTEQLWPGCPAEITGVGRQSKLIYEYDHDIWRCLERRPCDLLYSLNLPTALPVEGKKPMHELNYF